ncbi:MAG: TetR family transcriptional regulator [Bifidobacteriaceae bacterium]|jgi:AcrR family transcriptional regulator|nr:TetR family transcriptional regulator [Bifidobacteriaceae bacterium]
MMPLSTFDNLAQDRQDAIRKILLDVFHARQASEVTVSEIVAALGMSRGIFYKYFVDLTDAHDYVVTYYANRIHVSILRQIAEHHNDFFAGIETFLVDQLKAGKDSERGKQGELLTRNMHTFSVRPQTQHGVARWRAILDENGFDISDDDESVAFLFFMMHFAIDSLADAMTNAWTSEHMITEFRLKVRWLENGILRNPAASNGK